MTVCLCVRVLRSRTLLLLSATILFTLWLITQYLQPTTRPIEWREFEEEELDHRGIRVVVGHYLGDVNNDGFPVNITDGAIHCQFYINELTFSTSKKRSYIKFKLQQEMLNSNHFEPRPHEGKNGLPVIIPSRDISRMQALYTINRFNLMASDRIPLNRTLPDVRKKRCLSKYSDIKDLPTASIIIVFHNEAWSTLLRTVHSVISRSPRNAIKEIILVDDASTRTFLKNDLDDYVKRLEVSVLVLRTGTREGLVRARLQGAKIAKGDVLLFLDAHCECTTGWLEPLLDRVAQDRTKVVCPVIDIINDNTFAYVRSFELHWGAFNWNLHFRWYTLGAAEIRRRKLDIAEPFPTPAMAGGLFAIDKKYFFEIGAYDDQMEIWGGENLEMSFRVWQCGGTVEIAPCSHVGHLFRKSSPYSFPGGVGDVLYSNLARVALVWMDEWQEFFFKFNPGAGKQRDKQTVRKRLELRRKLQCRSFEWYLDNVWPQHFLPKTDRFFGQIKSELNQQCLTRPVGGGSLNQPSGAVIMSSCTDQLHHMFVRTREGYIITDESVCLDSTDQSSLRPKVKVIACSFSQRQVWTHDKLTKNLIHSESSRCLEAEGDFAVLTACTGYPAQKWTLNEIAWS